MDSLTEGSLEQLCELFCNKICFAKKTIYLKSADVSDDEDVTVAVHQTQVFINQARDIMLKMKSEILKQNTYLDKAKKNLLADVEVTKSHVDHMTAHQPKPKQPAQKTDQPECSAIEGKDATDDNDNVNLSAKKWKPLGSVASLSLRSPHLERQSTLPAALNNSFRKVEKYEYDEVPRYMKGRINLCEVNSAIDDLNKILEVKYKLLKQPRRGLKPQQLDLQTTYKRHECPETKDTRFCCDYDIKDHGGKFRLDKKGSNILVILRHCQRMREVRSNGVVRYCVL